MATEPGEGKGVGKPERRAGGTDTCVCPDCNYSTEHKRGAPCNSIVCPKCGSRLVGE